MTSTEDNRHPSTGTKDRVGEEVLVHPLAYVRHQRGWSLQDLVEVIARHSGVNMAAHRQKAWRWEHWNVVPDQHTQDALARALGVGGHEVKARGWPGWLPAWDGVYRALPWTPAGTLTALSGLEDAMVDRRGFLVLSGSALLALAHEWAEVPTGKINASLGGGRLDEEVICWVEQRIPGLRRMDDRLGGRALLRLIDAELRLVTQMLRDASYTSTHGARLYRAAGDLAQLAGWVAFDAGLHATAQRYYTTALHAAHTAGDDPLGANVLAGLSFQAALTGDPNDAHALAEVAQRNCVSTASPRTKAMLASREARAHAKSGNAAACAAALHHAETLLDVADRHEDPPWIYYFDPAELTAQAGACFVDLAQPSTALPLLEQALAGQDPSYVRDRTIYHLRLAATTLHLGDLEHACTLTAQAADLAEHSNSARSIATLRGFRRRLDRYSNEPAVHALDAHLTRLAG